MINKKKKNLSALNPLFSHKLLIGCVLFSIFVTPDNLSLASAVDTSKNTDLMMTTVPQNKLDISYKKYGINGYRVSLVNTNQKTNLHDVHIQLSNTSDFFIIPNNNIRSACALEKKGKGNYIIPKLSNECDFIVKAINLHQANQKTGNLIIKTPDHKYLFSLANNTYLAVGSGFQNTNQITIPAISRVAGNGASFSPLQITNTFNNSTGIINDIGLYTKANHKTSLIAVTNQGEIFSWDGGRSWKTLKSFGQDVSLNSVISYTYKGKSYLIVGGELNNQAIISQFDGKNWSQLYKLNAETVHQLLLIHHHGVKYILAGMSCGGSASDCIAQASLPLQATTLWQALMKSNSQQIASGDVNAIIQYPQNKNASFKGLIAAGSFNSTNNKITSLYDYQNNQWQNKDGSTNIPGITAIAQYDHNYNQDNEDYIIFPYYEGTGIMLQQGDINSVSWQPLNITNPIACRNCSGTSVSDMLSYYNGETPYLIFMYNEYDEYTNSNRAWIYYIDLNPTQSSFTFYPITIDASNFIINGETLAFYPTMTMVLAPEKQNQSP
ncbi:MAG: hypothetical protein AAGA27_05985 [Pseudomonadota bacterium]